MASDGTVSLLTVAAARNGTVCRGFTATINDLRGIRRYRGQSCRGADGWQLSDIVPDDGTHPVRLRLRANAPAPPPAPTKPGPIVSGFKPETLPKDSRGLRQFGQILIVVEVGTTVSASRSSPLSQLLSCSYS